MFADGGKRGVNGRNPGARGGLPAAAGQARALRRARAWRARCRRWSPPPHSPPSCPHRRGPPPTPPKSSGCRSTPPSPASIPSACRTTIRRPSSRRSSTGCSRTTTSRARRASSRWPPRRCPKSPTTAAPTRSGCGAASGSRPTRRSRAPQRELTAQDFVYSFMRFLDPVNRAPYAFMLEGQDPRPRRAGGGREEDREVRLRREAARSRGRRPLHAARTARADRLQLSLRARAHVVRRGGARGRRRVSAARSPRTRSAPARTCSPSGRARRRSCSSPIRTIARFVWDFQPPRATRGTRGSRRR